MTRHPGARRAGLGAGADFETGERAADRRGERGAYGRGGTKAIVQKIST